MWMTQDVDARRVGRARSTSPVEEWTESVPLAESRSPIMWVGRRTVGFVGLLSKAKGELDASPEGEADMSLE